MRSRVLVAVLAILLAVTAFHTVNALSAVRSDPCGATPECPHNECSGPQTRVWSFGRFCCIPDGGPCDEDLC
ncbi:MAG: hypothetical protein ACREL7_02615 [Longimicrobiales bacterium]